MFEGARLVFRKVNVTSRHSDRLAAPKCFRKSQRDVTPYRSPGCSDVLRGELADVTDFFLMTLVDKSVDKHNMLKLLHSNI